MPRPKKSDSLHEENPIEPSEEMTEPTPPPVARENPRENKGSIMNLKDLKDKKIGDLIDMAKEFNVEGAAGMRRQDLIFALLNAQTDKNGMIYGEGILEIL